MLRENNEKFKNKSKFFEIWPSLDASNRVILYSNNFEILRGTIFNYTLKHATLLNVKKNVQKTLKNFLETWRSLKASNRIILLPQCAKKNHLMTRYKIWK